MTTEALGAHHIKRNKKGEKSHWFLITATSEANNLKMKSSINVQTLTKM